MPSKIPEERAYDRAIKARQKAFKALDRANRQHKREKSTATAKAQAEAQRAADSALDASAAAHEKYRRAMSDHLNSLMLAASKRYQQADYEVGQAESAFNRDPSDKNRKAVRQAKKARGVADVAARSATRRYLDF